MRLLSKGRDREESEKGESDRSGPATKIIAPSERECSFLSRKARTFIYSHPKKKERGGAERNGGKHKPLL